MCIAFLEALESTHSVDVIEMLLHPLATGIDTCTCNDNMCFIFST